VQRPSGRRLLRDFSVMSFDCYGTLIDWESGIFEGLKPLLCETGADPSRDDVLACFARHEAQLEAAYPLALELAAPQVRLWSLDALLARMDRRLDVLVGGARDLPERQQTMRGTLEWSYKLLDGDEQSLFARLAIFVGSFEIDAVEEVCGVASVGARPALDVLASLVGRGLLRKVESSAGDGRLAMLETVREFALERLSKGGELSRAHRRHADYIVALAGEAQRALRGPDNAAWMLRMERELDNVRAALQWARAVGDDERGLRIVAELESFWERRGSIAEGRSWIDGILAKSDVQARCAPATHTISAERARPKRA